MDNRIVRAEFDNKQFEKGVRQTIQSLDELKKSLDLKGATAGLNELSKVGSGFNLSGIESAITTVSNRFSTLGIVGVTALTNITNTAVNAGKRIISSLTIDPVKSGLDEYETKMNAITTILTNTRSKGTQLSDINEVMAELNDYADKTIYNFAEMTRNIGTFTAAGIDLDTSAAAIKGIANLAAGSGSNAQQASTAMYQLSQALAAGSLKLQDWNSVVNAGMGGELFQNALKETATQMGIMYDKSVPFRESLKDGWVTAEVLTKTLSDFAERQDLLDAATQVKTITQLFDTMRESVQSGWAVSWENIIGDRDEAIEVLTNISNGFNNLIGPSVEARNNMLGFWNDMGGREKVIEGITNILQSMGSIIDSISGGFRAMFPRTTGAQLFIWSERFRELTERFKIGDEQAKKLRVAFEGFFSIIKLGVDGVKGLTSGILSLTSTFDKFDFNIFDAAETMGYFLIGLSATIRESDFFNNSLQSMLSKIGLFGSIVKKVAMIVSNGMKNMLDRFRQFREESNASPFAQISEGGKRAASIFGGMLRVLNGVLTVLSTIGSFVKAEFSKAFEGAGLENLFDAGIAVGIIAVLKRLFNLLGNLKDIAPDFKETIESILGGVTNALQEYQNSIKANTILKIAAAIGILTISLIALSNLNPTELGGALTTMSALLLGLFGSTGIFSKITASSGFKGASKIVITMVGLSISMVTLAKAIERISNIDPTRVKQATNTIIGLILILSGATAGLSFAGKEAKLLGMAVAMVGMSIAVKTLAKAVTLLGQEDPETLKKGLISVAILLAGIIALTAFGNLSAGGIASGLGLIAMATGILILGKAVEKMGSLSWPTILKGLGAVGALLLAVGVAAVAIPAPQLLLLGTALIAFATGMAIFTGSIAVLGNMSIAGLAKGIGSLAAVLAVLAIAGLTMGPLIPVLIGLGAAIALIGTGTALTGIGLTAIVAALVALTTISAAASVAIGALVTSLIVGLAAGLVGAAGIIAAGAPAFGLAFHALIRTGLDVIIGSIPVIVETLAMILVAFLNVLVTYTPQIVAGISNLMIAILNGIETYVPKIIEAAFKIAIALIEGFAAALRGNKERLKEAIYDVFKALVEVALSIFTNDSVTYDQFIDAGRNLVNGLIEGIKNAFSSVTTAAKELGEGALNTLKNVLGIHSPSRITEWFGEMVDKGMEIGIRDNSKGVTDEAGNVADGVTNEFSDMGEVGKTVGDNLTTGMANGISGGSKKVKSAYDQLSEWIANRKYFNELTLMEELVAWETAQKKYAEGSEERIKIDKEIYRVKKDLIEKQSSLEERYYADTKTINDKLASDIQAVDDQYNSSVASRAESIYGSYGLFDEVAKQEKVSGKQLLKNLEGQIDAIEEWRDLLGDLSNKGVDEGLMKELQEMGPSATAELRALNGLTSDELDQYVLLWKEKHEEAKAKATSELHDMRIESDAQIKKLREGANNELVLLYQDYERNLNDITGVTDVKMEDLVAKWDEKIKELRDNSINDFQGIRDDIEALDWEATGKAIVNGITSGVTTEMLNLKDAMVNGTSDAITPVFDAFNSSTVSHPSQIGRLMKVNPPSPSTRPGNYVDFKKMEELLKDMGSGTTIENNFDVKATIREDSDIYRTARELYNIQVTKSRE